MKLALLPLVLISCLLNSCSPKPDHADLPVGNSYAKGFSILTSDKYCILEIRDPWQNSKGVRFRYVLAGEETVLPDSLNTLPLLHVPVRRIICMSTSHLAMLEALGKSHCVIGASGTDYIYSPVFRKAVDEDKIKEVGYGSSLDYERILELKPDVVILYGVEGQVAGVKEKLRQMGIASVICGEYLEDTPLGRAEWIRFFAALTGDELKADSIFGYIDSSYHTLMQLASGHEICPEVLTGLPWKDVWYMAGGNSHLASLLKHAGACYLWKDSPAHEALPLNLEAVYQRAVKADTWINPGAATSLKDILDQDTRFSSLKVMQSGEVYNNNARMSPGGGNDYWESGVLRCDLVLKDLIGVLHPDLLPHHRFFYYRQLK